MSGISLEQELLSVLNSKNSNTFVKEESYRYESIFLTKIIADDTNPRFLPAIIMSDIHAYQFISKQLTKQQLINIYNAKEKVLIGKACMVNCCKYGSIDWKKANQTIESIIELAENVAVSEIIQVPTIYPVNESEYKILTGHRRFFAMVFNDGINSAAHFKVYDSKPILLKTKQFQENASREELPQYGKLKAFQDAVREVEILNTSKLRLGQKPLTVKETASLFGISMGAYDNYNVLTRYPAVIESFENGNTEPLLAVKKRILRVEKNYKNRHQLTKLSALDKKEINKYLKHQFNPDEKTSKQAKEIRDSIKPKNTKYKLAAIESPFIIETLLKKNVCEIDCGIDWNNINWQDADEINASLKVLIEFLMEAESNQGNNEQ